MKKPTNHRIISVTKIDNCRTLSVRSVKHCEVDKTSFAALRRHLIQLRICNVLHVKLNDLNHISKKGLKIVHNNNLSSVKQLNVPRARKPFENRATGRLLENDDTRLVGCVKTAGLNATKIKCKKFVFFLPFFTIKNSFK